MPSGSGAACACPRVSSPAWRRSSSDSLSAEPSPGVRTLRHVAELDTSSTEPVLEWDTPLFRMARAQYEQALPYADVSEMVADRLSVPERAVIVSVPLRRDDGSVDVF